MTRLAERYTVSTFFCGAYLWSWLFWVPAVILLRIEGGLGVLPIVLVFLGGLGPTISAIAVSWFLGRKRGIRTLVGKIIRKGTSPWAFIAAVVLPLAAGFGFIGLNVIFGGRAPSFSPARAAIAFLPRFLMVLPFGPLCEELGWRGFAVPRLMEHRSALTASLWLGFWWGLWHLPLFALPGIVMGPEEHFTIVKLSSYVLTTVGLSVIFTAVLVMAKGSVAATFLLHGVFNSAVPTVIAAFPGFAAASVPWAAFINAFSVLALALLCIPFLARREKIG
jgi:uncharacterized protein